MFQRRNARTMGWRTALLAFGLATCWTPIRAEDPAEVPEHPDFAGVPTLTVSDITEDLLVLAGEKNEPERIQLLGVDTPTSSARREGLRAFLHAALVGERVWLSRLDEKVRADRPESALIYRAPDGLLINLEVVRQGYARVAARPRFDEQVLFRKYERVARAAKKGVWTPLSAAKPPTDRSGVREDQAERDERPRTSPTDPGEQLVYVTRSGKKYHREDCPTIRRSKTRNAIPLREAALRYGPCKVCKPPVWTEPQ